MCVFSATRERETNEIIPASARQSSTRDDNEVKYGADKAIDLDLSTYSWTYPVSDGTRPWLEITLPVLSCIERVVTYYSNGNWHDGNSWLTFTCTETDCSRCEGSRYCRYYTLTVSTVISTDSIPQPTDCRLGDTVRLERTSGSSFGVIELAVIGEQGEIRYWYVRYTVVVL